MNADELATLHALDFDLECRAANVEATLVLGVLIWHGRPSKCGAIAVGMIECTFCGKTAGVCTAHRDRFLSPEPIVCAHCRASAPGDALYAYAALDIA